VHKQGELKSLLLKQRKSFQIKGLQNRPYKRVQGSFVTGVTFRPRQSFAAQGDRYCTLAKQVTRSQQKLSEKLQRYTTPGTNSMLEDYSVSLNLPSLPGPNFSPAPSVEWVELGRCVTLTSDLDLPYGWPWILMLETLKHMVFSMTSNLKWRLLPRTRAPQNGSSWGGVTLTSDLDLPYGWPWILMLEILKHMVFSMTSNLKWSLFPGRDVTMK